MNFPRKLCVEVALALALLGDLLPFVRQRPPKVCSGLLFFGKSQEQAAIVCFHQDFPRS